MRPCPRSASVRRHLSAHSGVPAGDVGGAQRLRDFLPQFFADARHGRRQAGVVHHVASNPVGVFVLGELQGTSLFLGWDNSESLKRPQAALGVLGIERPDVKAELLSVNTEYASKPEPLHRLAIRGDDAHAGILKVQRSATQMLLNQ